MHTLKNDIKKCNHRVSVKAIIYSQVQFPKEKTHQR
jgi:hypothetical protein